MKNPLGFLKYTTPDSRKVYLVRLNNSMEKRLYITQNIINGKVYAGKHMWKEGSVYMGSGYALKKAFVKYGKENFKIRWLKLDIKSSEDLDKREIRLIRLLKYRYGGKCYNIQKGGCGGYWTYYMNDEEKREVFDKISEGKKRQYANGETEKQIDGRIRQSETLKNRFKNDKDLYNKVFVEGAIKKGKSFKRRIEECGHSEAELSHRRNLINYSLVYVTYKLIYPDGVEVVETNTLKDFQSKYKTEDVIFAYIKRDGKYKFKRRISTTKHIFPVGTEIHYISEIRGNELTNPTI